MRTRYPAVYIMASRRNGTLYTGVTSNLELRVHRHKEKFWKGFTSRYGVYRLVYFEMYPTMREAIEREKWIKKRTRRDKLKLIEAMNPRWENLAEDWFD